MKKGFIQCITLIISAMLVFAQTYMVFAEEQQESKISAQYDATTDIFSVSGQIPEASKKFVTVIIAPQTIDITSDKTDALADDGVIIKTEQVDSEGKIDFKIKLPEFANKPRYTYTVSLDKIVISAMFSTVSEESLSPYLSAVNSGGLSAAKDFVANSETGLDDGKTKNKDFIASYINTVKPEGGHTAKTLMDAYMIGEGLSYVKSGEMNIGEVLTEYESYLDKDYAAEYEKLPTDIKQALNEAFVNDVVVENFDTTFNNNLFVAKYTTVDNSTELKEVLLDYIEKNNISLDEFNEINNAVYEDKVFNELYETCKNKKTLTAILDAFNAEVEAQQEAAEDAKDSASGGGAGSSGGGAGGSAGGTKGKISLDSFTPQAVAAFKDIETHWAKSYVESMHKRGIINGFTDGTFKPDLNVTRAEFAKMIAQILALDTTGDSDFSDVADNSWYNGYVAAVAKAGIVMGSDGKFMPDKNITRQDAAVMLARVLEYKGKTYNSESFGFGDEAKIAEYAKGAVNGMAHLGLITGYNGEFAPTDNTTRGQAAALLARACDYIQ